LLPIQGGVRIGRDFTSLPKRESGWRESFDTSQFDLRPIARIDSYRGFVFGSLAADVPDLRDHLGAAGALIDIFVAPAPQPLEVVSGYSIYVTSCNWKVMHENRPDAFHAPMVHNNFAAAIAYREKCSGASGLGKTDTGRLTARIKSASYDLGNGHNAFWHERPSPEAFPIYAQKDELAKRFTPGQLEWILGRGRHTTIFPNLLLNDLASTHLRVYRPLGLERMETIIWCIAPTDEPTEARAARLRKFEDFFLPSGMATPDDVAIVEAAQRASWAHASRWSVLSRGLAFCKEGPDEAARELGFTPRMSSDSWDHEIAIRGVYQCWLDMMERGGGASRWLTRLFMPRSPNCCFAKSASSTRRTGGNGSSSIARTPCSGFRPRPWRAATHRIRSASSISFTSPGAPVSRRAYSG
jgi:benzoate/toluate 1,2-dioxygenase alpha subunit